MLEIDRDLEANQDLQAGMAGFFSRGRDLILMAEMWKEEGRGRGVFGEGTPTIGDFRRTGEGFGMPKAAGM